MIIPVLIFILTVLNIVSLVKVNKLNKIYTATLPTQLKTKIILTGIVISTLLVIGITFAVMFGFSELLPVGAGGKIDGPAGIFITLFLGIAWLGIYMIYVAITILAVLSVVNICMLVYMSICRKRHYYVSNICVYTTILFTSIYVAVVLFSIMMLI